MRKFFSRLLPFLEQQSEYRLWGIILLSIVILGILDTLTGFEFSFSLFYILPVSLTAWTMGKNVGYFVCFISGLVWLSANALAGESYTNLSLAFWNTLIRTGFFIVVAFLLAELRQALETERTLARTDGLTGVLNRRAFYQGVVYELERLKRHQFPVTLVYVDLDDFKIINDRFGHSIGDHLLARVAYTIRRNIRTLDTVARLGGDEFAILLPLTDLPAAKTILPRLRWHLDTEMEHQQWPVTFSMGALTCNSTPISVDDMINQADQLMYEVKHTGKDSIAYRVI